MADIPEFEVPLWLKDQAAETIHSRMMETLPDDIDDTEGGFPWDFTKPTALEKAEMLESHLIETLKIMHPMWAYETYLDYHAKGVGTSRKNATYATGTVIVIGIPETVIPLGFLFAVPANGENPAIVFKTTAVAVIGSADDGEVTGGVEIPIEAEEPGTIGNVAAGTISIMASPIINGIVTITNMLKTTGGTEDEDDDSLRSRIMEINESSDSSFVGCDSDYMRWAKEVDGVGSVLIVPEWNGPGSVKVVVLDANGEPASTQIITNVLNNIVSPNNRSYRKSPIGATVTVIAPESLIINIACNIIIEESESVITERLKTALKKYYIVAKSEGVIRFNQIGAIIIGIEGVKDFDNLVLNSTNENIVISEDEYPVTGTLNLGV